ncbi:MAG: acetylglutamate kinase [Chloroflexi bacterium]|nr:acetylglutamate kinase [Chloroflexota bacterium]
MSVAEAETGFFGDALGRLAGLVGRTLVVKLGGSTVGAHDTSLGDVALLHRLGVRVAVVHGGGAAISQWLGRIGLEARFVRGLRVTDAPTLEVVCMVLAGKVNKELVGQLQALGAPAVGLSGADGGLLRARLRDSELGLVGEVASVEARPLLTLLDAGFLPLVAPLALGDGGQLLNVNADTAAGDVARGLGAEQVVFLTDVPGVTGTDGETLRTLSAHQVRELIAGGVIHGGMIPKVEACLHALHGARAAQIVDGRTAHALLRALLLADGGGTRITEED